MSIDGNIHRLGALRDGFIVAGGTLYGAGYATWALYALSIHAGPVPALQVQYFAAGIPAVLLFVAAVAAIGWSRRVVGDRWTRYVERLNTSRRIFMQLSVLVIAATLMLTSHIITQRTKASLAYGITSAALLILGFAALALISTPKEKVTRAITLSLSAVLPIIMGTVLFIRFIYPALPQELGGARPRLAILDVRTGDLSKETLAILGVADPRAAVARTAQVAIISQQSDTVLVVIGNGKLRGLPHLEVSRTAIVTFTWSKEAPAIE